MVAKYPGVEQADVERLLAALRAGDLGLVSHVEAGIALKSAQWLRAVLSVDA
jgi:cell division FtsZ-interacting protein ZapD